MAISLSLDLFVLNTLPFLKTILSPAVRSVAANLLTESEKRALTCVVSTMLSFNLKYSAPKSWYVLCAVCESLFCRPILLDGLSQPVYSLAQASSRTREGLGWPRTGASNL